MGGFAGKVPMCFLSSDLGLDLRCFCSHIQTCCGRGVSQQFEVPSQAVSECVHVNVILEAEIIGTFGQFLQQLVYCLALSGAGVADFEVFGVTIVRHLPRIFLVATLTPGGVGGLVSRVWLPSQRMLCLTIFLHQSLSGFVSCLCWTCGSLSTLH